MNNFSRRTNHKLIMSLLFVFSLLLVMPASADEQLIASISTDWKALQLQKKNNGNTKISEYIPANETEKKWSRKITFTQINDPKLDPLEYATKLQNQIKEKEHCKNTLASEAKLRPVNNYDATVVTVSCTKQDATHEVNMIKVIRGESNLYIIDYTVLTDSHGTYENLPIKQFLWNDVAPFMQRVLVCDDKLPNRGCPKTVAP